MENYQNVSTETNLLEEESLLLNQYEYATSGQRFLNYLIDNLLMNYGLGYATGYCIGIIINAIDPGLLPDMKETSVGFLALATLIGIMNYLVYYTICEKVFNGYTLGKAITRTRAIREDGNPLTFKDALLRALIRLVPFEAFTGFQTQMWHDKWSNTMVVKAR